MVFRWMRPVRSMWQKRRCCVRKDGENEGTQATSNEAPAHQCSENEVMTERQSRRNSGMTVTRRQFTATAASGIAATFTPAVAQQPQKLTVRTDFPPWGMHAGLHLAVDNGSFKDAGLDVDVSDGKGSSLVMQ